MIPQHIQLNLKRKDNLAFIRGDDKTSRLRDKTDDVFCVLFPDIPSDYVAFRSFLIVGTMESGKTSLLRYLAKKAIEKYGPENINIIGSNKFHILIDKMDNRPVQLLFMDDAFRHGKKLSDEEIANLFEIRHVYERKGNLSGLIIVGAVIQDFFAVEKKLRTNINVFFIKSFPSVGYDKNTYKKEFSSEGYRFLKRLTRQIFLKIDNTAKAYALVKFNFSDIPGYFVSEFIPITEDPVTWVLEDEIIQKQKPEIESGDIFFEEEKTIQDKELLKAMYDVHPITIKRLRKLYHKPFKKFKDVKQLQAWKLYYYDGLSGDTIGEMFGVSKNAILNKYDDSGWKSIIDRELVGHLAEDALARTYFKGYRVVAGENNPDLVNEELKVAVEVKVRRRFEGPSKDMLSTGELELLEQGWTIKLAIITYSPKSCTLYVYNVKKKKND